MAACRPYPASRSAALASVYSRLGEESKPASAERVTSAGCGLLSKKEAAKLQRVPPPATLGTRRTETLRRALCCLPLLRTLVCPFQPVHGTPRARLTGR